MQSQDNLAIGENLPPPVALFRMASSYWVSQAIYVAARLGIADLLKEGPMSYLELAEATASHPASLRRLLRALASLGVLATEQNYTFELTPIGASLQSSGLASVRSMILTLGEEHYHAWGELLRGIRSGEPAFNHVYGMDLFTYLGHTPMARTTFNEGMAEVTSLVSLALLASYDFSAFSQIVEVGGGYGSLIRAILTANPALTGVLFDSPQIIESAKGYISNVELNGRCQAVGGNFFDSVPRGGDAYILKNVIHAWDDSHGVVILRNCRRAMAENGKVLLVEMLLPLDGAVSLQSLMDLNMLVISGGRERTEPEYREILATAGLRITKIVPTISPYSVIEAVRI
jgi:O-methyltransferase/methyltransferase family protein